MSKYIPHHSILYRKLKNAVKKGPNEKGLKVKDYVFKYCIAFNIPVPDMGKKAIRKFIHNECNRIGSPIYAISTIKAPLKEKTKKPLTRKQEYRVYLMSPKWKDFRKGIIRKRGRKCENCGQTHGKIDLHHLTYIRIFNELPEDVQLLCRVCHEKEHNIIKTKS
jgi:5-methylcytosine-specific restriction endonuclease McrA